MAAKPQPHYQVVNAATRGDQCYANRKGWYWHELDDLRGINVSTIRGPYPDRAAAEDAMLRGDGDLVYPAKLDFAAIQKEVAAQIEATGSYSFPEPLPSVAWSTVDYLLRDMEPRSEELVRRYIAGLHRDLASLQDRADALDRARYSPGNGDMGG